MDETPGINLLKRAQTPQVRKARIKRVLNAFSMGTIIIFTVIFLTVAFLNFILSSKIKQDAQRINVAQTKINSLASEEIAYRAISDKLLAFEKILAQDKKYDKVLGDISNILPNGVRLSQISFTESGFSLAVTSQTLAPLNELTVNMVSKDTGGKYFKGITLEGLVVDEEGIYRIILSGQTL